MSTAPKSRRRGRYHHGNQPAALLEAALAMLESGEVDGLTLREVARRVGVTHAAPYRHFKDKAALLSALAEEGFERLRSALVEARRLAATPQDALAASRVAYVQFARHHAALFRLMFTPERAADAQVRAAADRLLGDVEQASNRLGPPSTARRRAVRTWAEWHGLATLTSGGWLDAEALGGLVGPQSPPHHVGPHSAGGSRRHDEPS